MFQPVIHHSINFTIYSLDKLYHPLSYQKEKRRNKKQKPFASSFHTLSNFLSNFDIVHRASSPPLFQPVPFVIQSISPYIRSINYITTYLTKKKKGETRNRNPFKLDKLLYACPRIILSNFLSNFDIVHPLLPRKYIYEARAARGQGSQLPRVRSSSATATLRNIPLCTYPAWPC